jgi:hypothetical protein
MRPRTITTNRTVTLTYVVDVPEAPDQVEAAVRAKELMASDEVRALSLSEVRVEREVTWG